VAPKPYSEFTAIPPSRTTLDNPVGIGHVNQHLACAVEEPDDLKTFKHQAAVFVEDALAVLEFGP
jgi:hypothetical protein